MPKFTVCLTQDVTRSTVVPVEAPSEAEAYDAALAAYHADECDPFEIDDGNAWPEPDVSWVESGVGDTGASSTPSGAATEKVETIASLMARYDAEGGDEDDAAPIHDEIANAKPFGIDVRNSSDGWHLPGQIEANEYRIVLDAGDPEIAIRGSLVMQEPDTVQLFEGESAVELSEASERALLKFARMFSYDYQ